MTVSSKMQSICTNYVLGGSQYVPEDTDCSGMVTACFLDEYGIEPPEERAWTGSMWSSPDSEVIYQGTSPELPWDKMQVDDEIYTSMYSPNFDTVDGSHVGVYTGNPDAPFVSHFCDGGPFVTAVNGVYGGRERYFGVKRRKKLMHMTLHEWMYTKLSTAFGNFPIWELVSWTYTYSRNCDSQNRELKKQLDEMNNKLDVILSKVGK